MISNARELAARAAVAELLYEMFMENDDSPEWGVLSDNARRIWVLRGISVADAVLAVLATPAEGDN
jgi:hypothetical protein